MILLVEAPVFQVPPTLPLNTTLPPAQKVVAPPAVIVEAVGATFTVILAPLSDPITTGFELTTRIRYPLPAVVPAGMVPEIVPAAVDVKVPMLTGLANEPAAFDNCAVNTLPALAAAFVVKGTLTAAPAQ